MKSGYDEMDGWLRGMESSKHRECIGLGSTAH